jgi:hypothetical protein
MGREEQERGRARWLCAPARNQAKGWGKKKKRKIKKENTLWCLRGILSGWATRPERPIRSGSVQR